MKRSELKQLIKESFEEMKITLKEQDQETFSVDYVKIGGQDGSYKSNVDFKTALTYANNVFNTMKTKNNLNVFDFIGVNSESNDNQNKFAILYVTPSFIKRYGSDYSKEWNDSAKKYIESGKTIIKEDGDQRQERLQQYLDVYATDLKLNPSLKQITFIPKKTDSYAIRQMETIMWELGYIVSDKKKVGKQFVFTYK